MSAALLRFRDSSHSHRDDLQSVFWIALESSLNKLEHKYHDLPGVVQCYTEYHPLTDDGGNAKVTFLAEGCHRVQFVGNPAFSDLMRDFSKMMFFSHMWDADLVLSKCPGVQPAEVPDHERVLQRFREALSRPDEQWSLELCDDKDQLWRAIEDFQRAAGSSTERFTTTESSNHSQPNDH